MSRRGIDCRTDALVDQRRVDAMPVLTVEIRRLEYNALCSQSRGTVSTPTGSSPMKEAEFNVEGGLEGVDRDYTKFTAVP